MSLSSARPIHAVPATGGASSVSAPRTLTPIRVGICDTVLPGLIWVGRGMSGMAAVRSTSSVGCGGWPGGGAGQDGCGPGPGPRATSGGCGGCGRGGAGLSGGLQGGGELGGGPLGGCTARNFSVGGSRPTTPW